MADNAWKKIAQKVKAKRVKKIGAGTSNIRKIKNKELVVQRLSADVSGQAQKNSRIGPREFVPFDDEVNELTIVNIKTACEKHFRGRIGSSYVCDILAGEQGPSCKNIEQVPDMNIIYVRFIPVNSISVEENMTEDLSISIPAKPAQKRPREGSLMQSSALSENSPFKKPRASMTTSQKNYPGSMSVSDMMKLGKLADGKESTVINVYKFDITSVTWSQVPIVVEFKEEKTPFGSGAFRKAYKAVSNHAEFRHSTRVIKRYLPQAVDCIGESGMTVEEHTRKVVQMHLLARNFALQLEEKVRKDKISSYGEMFHYQMIYFGKTDREEYVTIEEFVPGQFTKYLNNTGIKCVEDSYTLGKKAESLTHFSYEKSQNKLMLVDIQGNGYKLFDPEIASADLFDNSQKLMFCTGNLSMVAHENFTKNHTCNEFCNMLGLDKAQNEQC